MLSRNLWKLILSAALVLWAVFTLLPLQDQVFSDYLATEASAKPADFAQLMTKVRARIAENKARGTEISYYVALRQIGKEERLDLSQFFPHIKLESTLKNVEKRNDILLAHLLKESKAPLQLGLDLKGGVAVTLEAPPPKAGAEGDYQRRQQLSKAIDIIGNRINGMGVAEPVIRPVGNSRIEVQLAGLNTRDNPDVVDQVRKPAQLAFRLVQEGTGPMAEAPDFVPPGYEVLSLDEDDRVSGRSYTTYYLVKRIPEMSGSTVSNAQATVDPYGSYQVHLNFNPEGTKRFADVTTANSGRLLGIVLDGKLYSAPRINEPITGGSAQITGRFSAREAEQLANVLNNPLDLELQVKEQYEVGPSLAQDAIDSGVRASIIGTAAVCAFMVTFYATGGLVAVFSLAVNIVLILGTMASIGATMTMPGLAGIVLTIGMAVDANILIFERMREELALGKTLSSANQGGFIKALTTILDAHFVQLLICGIMIWLGTGPIKGFGVTLLIGVLSTLFSVLITAHMIMEMLIDSSFLRKITMRRMLKDLNVDFIKYGKPAAIGSVALVVVSLAYVVYQGDHIYGIDFAGGDQVTANFTRRIDPGRIRQVAAANGIGEVSPTYVSDLGGGRQQLKLETAYGKSGALFTALQKADPDAGLVKAGESQIGATIGKEIKWNAILAVGVSMCVILVYIAFRFEFGFGIGAMASTLHDILMNIGIFVLFGHQFSAPMVAAILCVAGYSINETVVVFDRIREELKINPTGSLRDIINNAIRKVFARTIMTATTTFLAALALYLFGGGQLHDIAFTFLVGILTSTFSAIFIAAQVFYWWHKGDRKHVEAHHDIAPKYEWQGTSKAAE
ncbi:MAG: protein translocase subunit SecD [Opitutae bacterium]|nr:protein translocase subunit SecD [Opitutae bacterium]